MNNVECEKQLLDLIERAWQLFVEANPEGWHLSMFATKDGCCAMGYRASGDARMLVLDGFRPGRGII